MTGAVTEMGAAEREAGDDGLPGNILLWVLIVSELLVFTAALGGFAVMRLIEPQIFSAGHARLSPLTGSVNTAILLTSGLFAALALERARQGARGASRLWLMAAAALGSAFIVIKIAEYARKLRLGLTIDTDSFFTLYYLITGFHLAHVIFGAAVLLLAAAFPARDNIQAAAMFWHLVDLVWVMVFAVMYLGG